MTQEETSRIDVAEVPFSRLVGLRRASAESSPLLELPFRASLTNHLGTLHASAQLALAEAASGECLQKALPEIADQIVAVVREVNARFRSPATGSLRAHARVDPGAVERLRTMLGRKGVGRIEVRVELRDPGGRLTADARYQWLLKTETE